jgi:hypothetical protein
VNFGGRFGVDSIDSLSGNIWMACGTVDVLLMIFHCQLMTVVNI